MSPFDLLSTGNFRLLAQEVVVSRNAARIGMGNKAWQQNEALPRELVQSGGFCFLPIFFLSLNNSDRENSCPPLGSKLYQGKIPFPNTERESTTPQHLWGSLFAAAVTDLYISPGFQSQKVPTWHCRRIQSAQESLDYGRRLAMLA